MNYFDFDDDVIYEIYIDNDGDVVEDIIFWFELFDIFNDIVLNIGGEMVFVLLKNMGDVIDNVNV